MLNKNIFLTKKEAKDFQNKLIVSFSKRYCPVCNGNCKINICDDFYEGSILNISIDEKLIVKVYPPKCVNSLFYGIVGYDS